MKQKNVNDVASIMVPSSSFLSSSLLPTEETLTRTDVKQHQRQCSCSTATSNKVTTVKKQQRRICRPKVAFSTLAILLVVYNICSNYQTNHGRGKNNNNNRSQWKFVQKALRLIQNDINSATSSTLDSDINDEIGSKSYRSNPKITVQPRLYTQDDIIRLVQDTESFAWMVLIYVTNDAVSHSDSAEDNSTSSSSSSLFYMYRLSNSNATLLKKHGMCFHCDNHMLETIIDGWMTLQERRRHQQNHQDSSSSISNASTLSTLASSWQVVLDGIRDYVHLPCFHDRNRHEDINKYKNSRDYSKKVNNHHDWSTPTNTTCSDYPPILTMASIYKIPTLPFLYQYPTMHFNECLYGWRQHQRQQQQNQNLSKRPKREQRRRTTGSETPSLFCRLQDIVHQISQPDAHKMLTNHIKEGDDDDSHNVWSKLVPQVIWRGTNFPFLEAHYRQSAYFHQCWSVAKNIRYLSTSTTQVGETTVSRKIQSADANNLTGEMTTISHLDNNGNNSYKNSNEYSDMASRCRRLLLSELLPQNKPQQALQQHNNSSLLSSQSVARLTPRCYATAMSLQAEEEWLNQQHQLNKTGKNRTEPLRSPPWINFKYDRNVHHHEVYRNRGYGCILSDFISPLEMSKYRYQIDLGGVGGTSWMGTITKLAMPGLLFHHETPTKDWFYDEIQPWVHYVPIHTDLSNLHDMFLWAEAHPKQAQQIARQGQEYARYHVNEQNFAATFEKLYVNQLEAITTSYTRSDKQNNIKDTRTSDLPVSFEQESDIDDHGAETLESILQRYEEAGVRAKLVATCRGIQCHY